MLPASKRAFSLVELSIVLVILGLLVGGVLTGQSLIRTAELRSVTTDLERYRTSVYTFRDKYFALPGDMTNATQFWGAADGNDGLGADCANLTTASSGTQTCNGNGDGRIGFSGWCTDTYERYRAWQQLQNAGLMEGKLSGTQDAASLTATYACRSAILGFNTPRSRIARAGFDMLYRGGTNVFLWNKDTNYIMFGAQQIVGSDLVELEGAAIKPEEAWNLDTKMDDGMPFTGKLKTYTYNWYGKFCTNSGNTAYDMTNNSISCALGFEL